MHTTSYHVPDEQILSEFFRESVHRIVGKSRQGCGFVPVWFRVGRKTDAFRLFSELRIIPAADQLINRRRMAVHRIQITKLIECQSERVHPSVSCLLNPASIWPEPTGIHCFHRTGIPILSCHGRMIYETMIGLYPAIQPPGKTL